MAEVQLFVSDPVPLLFENRCYERAGAWASNNNHEYNAHSYLDNSNMELEDASPGSAYDNGHSEVDSKEKELYLCSNLGIFLLQEIENILIQQKNLVNDHTRVLLDLQSYEASKSAYLDLGDSASEFDTLSTLSSTLMSPHDEISTELQLLKQKMQQGTGNATDHLDKLSALQVQVFSFGLQTLRDKTSSLNRSSANKTSQNRIEELEHNSLKRSGSIDSLNESIAESTLTNLTSTTKHLQSDLDRLQHSHERITRLEVQLDSTRTKYRDLMTKYTRKLKEISQSLGSCVDKARPYFNTMERARKAQIETRQAAMQYKRAVNLQKAGRDMVKVAEDRLMSSSDKFDTTWQEMLNQATLKVNEASREKDHNHKIHMRAAKNYKIAEASKNEYQATLQRSIVKSKPYYEVQQDFQSKLEATTKKINRLEMRLLEARQTYTSALSAIRRSGDGEGSSVALDSLAERGTGVGAENPCGDASVLPKPMQDLLVSEGGDPLSKKKCSYNQYDQMYLNDTSSDNGSAVVNEGDDYIQDF